MGSPRIVVRKMREGDLSTVSDLAMLANPFTTKEAYFGHLEETLKENPDLSFVAARNGEVVGYVQADVPKGGAVLEDIAVAREHQGKGIGTRLLDEELRALRQRGAEAVLAEVHYRCASAIPFYYRHGFRIVGFERDCFGDGHDAIIVKRVLD
jgi:ribosomal-protein-alanine N-acetyltransferase